MRSIKVFFSNGDHISTNINGTDEEILAYYIGNEFNLGEGGNDLMTKAIRVEFLEAMVRDNKQIKIGDRVEHFCRKLPNGLTMPEYIGTVVSIAPAYVTFIGVEIQGEVREFLPCDLNLI